jgi:alkaline phosphatase D
MPKRWALGRVNTMTKSLAHSRACSRRKFVASLGAAGAGLAFGSGRMLGQDSAPAIVVADKNRPGVPCGVMSGDVTSDSAVVWCRTDRPAQMLVEVATSDKFADPRRVRGPNVLPETDFTGKLRLDGLPAGEQIFYRVTFEDLAQTKVTSVPVVGSFRTAPVKPSDVVFAWSGDVAGQGFGINLEWGGMKGFEAIRQLRPQFFIHSGDTIYADGPIPAEIKLDDGTLWKNVTTEAKSKPAESLAEFRGNYLYNLRDENVRRFNAEVPQLVQWDDHETLNNWYPGETLDDKRYREKSVSLLAARARRAFFEYQPIGQDLARPERIYRSFARGPLLDVFMLDQRTYKGPNSPNRQSEPGPETAFMGREQIAWLKRGLLESKATWKVLASDMPIGLLVRDGAKDFENAANGNGPALGRELEIADLLKFIQTSRIKNVVWLTADVHYAAAHYYDPAKAQFTEFDPFWEFVAGPLNAGTFGPGQLDNTFGPEVKFHSLPQGMKGGRPPSDGLQFFGLCRIDGKTAALTVELYNIAGKKLYSVDVPAEKA